MRVAEARFCHACKAKREARLLVQCARDDGVISCSCVLFSAAVQCAVIGGGVFALPHVRA